MKRLKRGREEPSFTSASKSVEKIFSDEEEEAPGRDDLNDFIADEDDDLDEVLGDRYRDDRDSYYDDDRVRRPKAGKGMMEMLPEGLSEE